MVKRIVAPSWKLHLELSCPLFRCVDDFSLRLQIPVTAFRFLHSILQLCQVNNPENLQFAAIFLRQVEMTGGAAEVDSPARRSA